MFKDNIIDKAIREIRDKLFYVKIRDIFSMGLLFIAVPYALILKFTQKNVWLVCERRAEARDNGYVFFKYVSDHTNAVNIYYVIDKKSSDYKKLQDYENRIISFGSVRHMAYYLACDAVVTTVKNCGPNDLMGYLFRKIHLTDKKIYFIQHGIIINDLKWLHFDKTRFRAITCGAYPEYEFVRDSFGYPKESVIFISGLCRHDQLHDIDIRSRKFILVMPTWRKWLKHNAPGLEEIEHTQIFTETNYYKNWISLIQNEELLHIIKRHGLKLVFYPHPLMQHYIKEFKSINEDVIIASEREWDIQKLIRNAAMLITDYSSVFTDFIYMKKPVLFYQFDLETFRRYHYSEGYFRYDDNPFSDTVYCLEDVNGKLNDIISRNFTVDSQYLEGHKKYFPIYDTQNTERTYNAIYKMVKSQFLK